MDRPCGLLHPGPAAGPLQSTFPQREPGPRELRAQAPPPSPATGWRRTRPRPESRARRAARNCLLLCCCCATTWLFFFKKKKILLQIKLCKAPPEADPDLRTPPRGQKVALPAALVHQRIRRCATFQKVNCLAPSRYRRGAHQRILRKQLEVPRASPWHCRISWRASLSMTD